MIWKLIQKALVWKVITTLIVTVLVLINIGDVKTSIEIGLVSFVLTGIAYVVFELVWKKLHNTPKIKYYSDKVHPAAICL